MFSFERFAVQTFLCDIFPCNDVIAGGAARSVLELAGISDIITKCLGSRTKINVVRATVEGLKSLKTLEEVAALRGKKPEEIRG